MPCGTSVNPTPCNQCDLLRLLKNIIDFVLIGLMPPAAAILFVWGGFLILMGGANPGWMTQGKSIFWNTAIGIAIISSSWLITNTIIRSIAADNVAPEWWKFECRVTTGRGEPLPVPQPQPEPGPEQPPISEPEPGQPPAPQPPGPQPQPPAPQPPAPPTTGDTCSVPQTLAKEHNEVYPAKRSPELNTLLSCISNRLKQTIPSDGGVSPFYGSMYTFDQSSILCNYTRGDKHCDSSCGHTTNSCHYGGRTGTVGSLAVDFGNEKKGDIIIQAAIACGVPASKARCENAAGRNVGCALGSSANHIHISTPTCDAN